MKGEMFRPNLSARIEEKGELPGLRIERAEIAAFESVAPCARACQVIDFSSAAVFFGDDVINFVWIKRDG